MPVTKRSQDRTIFARPLILAIGVPVGAALWIGQRTQALADHLGEAAGVQARVGTVDADLTGRIRLSDVALGELFAADAIEASVALDSLLSGQFGADEIRVANPHVAVEIDRNGDSDLARLVRRFARPRGRHPAAPRGALRRGYGGSSSAPARSSHASRASASCRPTTSS